MTTTAARRGRRQRSGARRGHVAVLRRPRRAPGGVREVVPGEDGTGGTRRRARGVRRQERRGAVRARVRDGTDGRSAANVRGANARANRAPERVERFRMGLRVRAGGTRGDVRGDGRGDEEFHLAQVSRVRAVSSARREHGVM